MLRKLFDVEEIKKAWKYYSTYAFLLIMGLPELYNMVATSGLIDLSMWATPSRMMQYAALAGLILRYVKQKGDEAKAKAADEADEAGA